MESRTRNQKWRSRRVAAFFIVVLLGVFLHAPGARAQGVVDASSPRTGVNVQTSVPAHVRDWLETVRFDTAPPRTDVDGLTFSRRDAADSAGRASLRDDANASAQRGRYRGRRYGRHRGSIGLVLGALGGFAAGGAIGVAVAENSYHGDNPALHGFVIGAPIGAVVGGFIGYAITR